MKYLANALLTLGTMHYLAFAAEKLKGASATGFIVLITVMCIVTIDINRKS